MNPDPAFFGTRHLSLEMLRSRPEGLSMAYEWDEGRARKMRLIKLASLWALTASALSVPVALLLTASPQ
jgi:hypothetical protein